MCIHKRKTAHHTNTETKHALNAGSEQKGRTAENDDGWGSAEELGGGVGGRASCTAPRQNKRCTHEAHCHVWWYNAPLLQVGSSDISFLPATLHPVARRLRVARRECTL